MLFLDANAHIPLNPKALEGFSNYNKSICAHGHPMSKSSLGRRAQAEMEEARTKIAHLIGAKSGNQIVFTSTCTQACDYSLKLLKAQNFEKVYTSTLEHKSISIKARQLFGNNDLFCTKDGIVSCSFKPSDKKCAFVCIHVQNEIGTIQSIEDIQVPFLSDMCQSLGKIPVNVSNISNLKIAAFGAHKFGGPSSVGFIYVQDPGYCRELGTGSRYFFDRPGTPDVGSVVATSIALEEAIKTLPKRYENALNFRDTLEDGLIKKGIEIVGSGGSRIPHTTFLRVRDKMASYIMTQLESDGLHIGLGTACGSWTSNSNPIVTSLGLGGGQEDYIRISQWGNYGEKEAKLLLKYLLRYL